MDRGSELTFKMLIFWCSKCNRTGETRARSAQCGKHCGFQCTSFHSPSDIQKQGILLPLGEAEKDYTASSWMRVVPRLPPPLRDLPSTLTWFARDWLDGQSQLGVRGDRERLVAWGEGWDHDIRHIDLLRAKKPCVSPPEAQTAGRPWTEGRRGGEVQGLGIYLTPRHLSGLSTCPRSQLGGRWKIF